MPTNRRDGERHRLCSLSSFAIGKAKFIRPLYWSAGQVPATIIESPTPFKRICRPNLCRQFDSLSPSEQAFEAAAVQLFLDKGVKVVEASASWP